MAGPSFAGPLTGWTSGSLAPKSGAVPGVAQAVTVQTAQKAYDQAKTALAAMPPGNAGKTAEQLAEYTDLQQKASAARRTLNAAIAGTDPAKQTKARLADMYGLVSTDIQGDTNLPAAGAPPVDPLTGVPLGGPVSGGGGGGSMGGGGGSGSGNLDQYDLTPSELGGGLAPDPRRAVAPTTGLETLLASIFPDAAAGGAAADPFADPRNPGPAPSLLNTILGNLGQPQQQSGGPSFGGPQFAGPNTGQQIANTIPGAPPFLGGAINNLQGGGGSGYFAPPAPAFNPLTSLGGIAAISAEQRQQQLLLQQQQELDAARYYERVRLEQEKQDAENRMRRLSGAVGAGFTPISTTKEQEWLRGWTPNVAPVYTPYTPTF